MVATKISLKQTKEEKILEAASQLFRQQGFEKTSIEEIARAIPMSKATLYTVFPNKDEILLSLCVEHCKRLDAKLIAEVDATRVNHLECLMDMIKIMALSIYTEASSIKTPEAQVYVSARIRASLTKQLDARRRIFHSILDKAVKAKELPGGTDTKHLCEVVMTAITSFLPPYNRHFSKLNVSEHPPLKTFTTELNTLTSLLLTGLKQYKIK